MPESNILIIAGGEVASLLDGREVELIDTVRMAYEAHARGESSLPHSTFLRFPGEERNRIIALPAYLGREFGVAGVKWVASFPNNLNLGLDRAFAVVILNSPLTGKPEVVIEGSIISAKRTAASAALAAQCLRHGDHETCAGLVGCGLINFEVARFLIAACPEIKKFSIFDLDEARANHFKQNCRDTFAEIEVDVARDVKTVFHDSRLISFATTAVKPHLFDLSACAPGSTILHVSLRDLSPELILTCDNVVDDIDHVCRAQTSVHLAEQMVGNRDFIRCSLADILLGVAPARKNPESTVIFSPFGLGILDLAVSKLVCDLGLEQDRGTVIESFLPEPWSGKQQTPN